MAGDFCHICGQPSFLEHEHELRDPAACVDCGLKTDRSVLNGCACCGEEVCDKCWDKHWREWVHVNWIEDFE